VVDGAIRGFRWGSAVCSLLPVRMLGERVVPAAIPFSLEVGLR
jgi:hypothetical protein